MRSILGLIAGILVAVAAMLVISQIGAMFFPVTSLDADARDPEQFSAAFRGAPIGTKLSLILAFLGASWAGGVVARLVSRQGWTVWAIAGLMLLLALAILNIIALPVWMQFALFVAPLLGGVLARHLPAERERVTVREEAADAPL